MRYDQRWVATATPEQFAAAEQAGHLEPGYQHDTPAQLTRADLATMSATDIVAAHESGQLDDLLDGDQHPA